MLKNLLLQLFEKLENEHNNNTRSKSGNANYFVNVILEEGFKKPNLISARALVQYYDKYADGKENNSGEPTSELKNIISQYLGFENYHDFEEKNKTSKKIHINLKNTKVKYAGVAAAILLITGVVSYNTSTKIDCIQWKENHYEKVECNGAIPNPLLKDVNIDTFKKIIPNASTTFFEYGHPIVWYGKSSSGEMEFFNSRGVHPETMKELKPITKYIIDKYIR
jgi:hypothetical protein